MTRIITAAEAEAAGYASFNDVRHVTIDVPDGAFTISARTSDGRRITFCFLESRSNEPPSFVDVVYHDHGTTRTNGRHVLPTFDQVAFGRGGNFLYDSRPTAGPEKPGIVTIFMERQR